MPLNETLVNSHLRVTKWIGMIPAVAVCALCSRSFTVLLSALNSVGDAQKNLLDQFTAHHCKIEIES